MMSNYDFSILEPFGKDDTPTSSGFWYDICDGDGDKFINLLKNPETKEVCRNAIRVLSSLENAVEDYVDWI